MAYFYCGTEGVDYQARYCRRCVNRRDIGDGRGEGCPVFDVHFLYNSAQNRNPELREALAVLIPHKDGEHPGECAMFLAKAEAA